MGVCAGLCIMRVQGENYRMDGDDNLLKELGEAVSETVGAKAAPEGEVAEAKAEVEPAKDPEPAETDAAKDDPKPFEADDALIERAVKAGLSVADAKAFANKEQADRILTALEAKTAKPGDGTKGAADKGGEGFPTDEFDAIVKAMEDDKDEDGNSNFDPNILKALKAMGSLAKSQAKELAALRAAGKTAAAVTSFDKGFAGLDEGVRSHVDAATKSQLRKKFDFLKSAHESAKDGAKDEEVFGEAVKLVLGDIVQTASAENKAAALEQRASLRLARPGGQSGLRGQDKPMTEEEMANALFDALTK